MTMPPHWLDDVIEKAYRVSGDDAAAIGRAIGESERFVAAIEAGLADHPHGRPGMSPAQTIRQSIIESIEAPTAAH
jgi:hypothetical protein